MTYNLNEINKIAKYVITSAKHKVLLFNGEMGVGKTTLIKEICKELGVEDVSHSPTFSLVNEYQTCKNEIVYHFDFYRIEDENEAYDIGVEDYFYSGNWCFIEWSENVKNLLPLDATIINIVLTENEKREITIIN
ncbi:MAG: tRNA (adenosine(37)-N6)-threonylcarbamoyltransferase complex ATPase subunit type 1 TsaE [Polaribacter sp.]|nr:MAG: tRNA (adenosine(37)-N6)-threonylcarbamoyltransferase complex ATPase subunit type 1 TsaE [Polaribacter sp.]